MAENIRPDCARSVINRPLPDVPPPPANCPAETCSLVLFYQYVEPPWTEKEHREALKKTIVRSARRPATRKKFAGRCHNLMR